VDTSAEPEQADTLGAMKLHATDDVEEYAAAVTGFFAADPCARNVPWTVMDLVRRNPGARWDAPPGFWWLSDGEQTVGSAHWTPPYPLLVTAMPDPGCEVTQQALSRETVRECMLFVETANSVAKSIYAQIGYRPAGEHVEIRLEPHGPDLRAAVRISQGTAS
jgi:hypothetical protein